MPTSIRLGTFQIGTAPRPEEGMRIAVTRRPQRGVKTVDLARRPPHGNRCPHTVLYRLFLCR